MAGYSSTEDLLEVNPMDVCTETVATNFSPCSVVAAYCEQDFMGDLLEVNPMDVCMKTVAAKVSPCVVGVASFGISEEVTDFKDRLQAVEDKFYSSGAIIECEEVGDGRYFSTILAPATLFKHNGLQPNQVKVYVYLSDSEYKGELLACDFHYNLAAIRIQSESPLQAATLRGLDDILPIDLTQQIQLFEEKPFELRSHSNLFKILPGTKIISLRRDFTTRRPLQVACGICCVQFSPRMDCNELYHIKNLKKFDDGGPVCNYLGEVIGIIIYKTSFLPINLISRWWNHYKSYREFRRPWLGLKVANLHTACLDFLQQFLKEFPDVSAGVVVIKIAEDSPAFCSGIRPKDVIVKCDGGLVRSNLEFFEKIWDEAGKYVELTVLRASDGSQFNSSMTIGETPLDKFYRWHLPTWRQGGRNSPWPVSQITRSQNTKLLSPSKKRKTSKERERGFRGQRKKRPWRRESGGILKRERREKEENMEGEERERSQG